MGNGYIAGDISMTILLPILQNTSFFLIVLPNGTHTETIKHGMLKQHFHKATHLRVTQNICSAQLTQPLLGFRGILQSNADKQMSRFTSTFIHVIYSKENISDMYSTDIRIHFIYI